MKKKKKENKKGKVILILNIIMTIWIVFCILALNGVFFKPNYSDTNYSFLDAGSFMVLFTIIPTVILSLLFNILLFVNKNVKNYKFLFIIPLILYIATVAWSFNAPTKKEEVVDAITCVKDGKEKEYKIYKDKNPDGNYDYSIKALEEEWMDEEDDYYDKVDTKSSAKIVKENISEIYRRHGGSCK